MKFALPSGTIIKGKDFRYRIVKVLGRGSFGITYLVEVLNAKGEATHIRLAMKEFFMNEINGRQDEQVTCNNENGLFSHYRKAFMEKARSMASARHENIARVGETFESNNTAYFLKNYIEGGTLESLVESKGKLTELHALEIAALIAKALGAMHASGNTHIDLRPGNVMMISGMVPVLIDFGITHHCDANGKPESVTRVGLGTPGYAPLELPSYRGDLADGKRVDVYGLGATLFRMLTGERPPQADKILNDGFPEQSLKESGVSSETIYLVKKAMEPSVGDRFPDVETFGKALAEILRSRFDVEITSAVKEIAPKEASTTPLPATPVEKEEEAVPAREAKSADIDYDEYPEEEKKRDLPVLLYVLCSLGIILVGLAIYFFIIGSGKSEEKIDETTVKTEVAVSDSDSASSDTLTVVTAPAVEETKATPDRPAADRDKMKKGLRKEPLKEKKAEPAPATPEAKPSAPAPSPATAPTPAAATESSGPSQQ